MTTVALEGTGARIVFADSHISADLISLTIDERAREIIETTHLGTPKAKTYTPAKDLTRGKVVAVFDHVPESAILTGRPPQMVRIEYPATDGDVSSISFPAAATRQGKEEMRFDQRMVTEVELVVVDVRDILGYTAIEEPVVVVEVGDALAWEIYSNMVPFTQITGREEIFRQVNNWSVVP